MAETAAQKKAREALAAAPESSDPAQVPVYVALSRVMSDVQKIAKDDQTNAAGKYHYRGVDRTMNEVGPALRRHGVIAMPFEVTHFEHRDVTTSGGSRQHEVIIGLRYEFTGPMGDKMYGAAMGESADSSDKATAQAEAVALRTILLHGLCIPTGDADPDEHSIKRAPQGSQNAPRPSGATRTPDSAPAAQKRDAVALGWASDAELTETWKRCLDAQKKLDAAFLGDVIAWGREQQLDPTAFTPDQGRAWWALLTAAKNAEQEAATEGADKVAEQFPGAEDVTGTPEADPAAQPYDPGSEPF